MYIPDTELEDPYNSDPMRLWENNGNGTFKEVALRAGMTNTAPSMGMALFDYDNDGDQDVFIVHNGGAPILYRNDIGNNKNYLRVKVVNESGITPAYNTLVTISQPKGPVQRYEINGGNNYLSQSEPIAHFGLGESETVGLVTAEWQDGFSKTYSNVSANTTLVVSRDD